MTRSEWPCHLAGPILALALAMAGCGEPDSQPGDAYQAMLDEAPVVFEATVRSIEMVSAEHGEGGIVLNVPADTVVVGIDARWLVTADVDAVRRGKAAAGWSGEKRFAIRSPAKTFHVSAGEAVGRRYVFHLFGEDGDGGDFFLMVAEPQR